MREVEGNGMKRWNKGRRGKTLCTAVYVCLYTTLSPALYTALCAASSAAVFTAFYEALCAALLAGMQAAHKPCSNGCTVVLHNLGTRIPCFFKVGVVCAMYTNIAHLARIAPSPLSRGEGVGGGTVAEVGERKEAAKRVGREGNEQRGQGGKHGKGGKGQ